MTFYDTIVFYNVIDKRELMGKTENAVEYEISMVLDTENNPIDNDTLMDKFIEWVESNNWYCGGTIFLLMKMENVNEKQFQMA